MSCVQGKKIKKNKPGILSVKGEGKIQSQELQGSTGNLRVGLHSNCRLCIRTSVVHFSRETSRICTVRNYEQN